MWPGGMELFESQDDLQLTAIYPDICPEIFE